MTMHMQCDYCGNPITDQHLMVRIKADGYDYADNRIGNQFVLADLGHYHATEDQRCWAEMLDRISLIQHVSSTLSSLPAGHREQKSEGEDERRMYRNRRNAWKQTSWTAREAVLLDAIGDDQLVLREMLERVRTTLAGSCEIYQQDIRSLAMRMLASGQLERVPETFRNKPRWRWHRKRGLDGPIADLERAYQDPDQEGKA